MPVHVEVLSSLVWPLVVVLLGLFVLRRIRQNMDPIFDQVVSGVAKSARANAPAYAIAILFGLSASLSAFVDVFKEMNRDAILAMSWHQYLVCWAKVLNPFVVAILAYATQNKFKGGNPPNQPPDP